MRFGKVVLGASGEGAWVKTFEEFFCGMGELGRENGSFFLYVFTRVLWMMCVVYFLLCDGGCYFLEFRFFLDLYRCFSLEKRKAWGVERLN